MGLTESEFATLQENMRVAAGVPLPPNRRAKTPEAMAEKELEQQCTNILALDGWRPLKTNPVSRRGRGAGFGELGMADYLYMRYGMANNHLPISNWRRTDSDILWIEWKRDGGKAEDHQKRWHELERNKGALVLVAGVDFPATVEGFHEWYRGSGLCRA